jgi:hypothetical protein
MSSILSNCVRISRQAAKEKPPESQGVPSSPSYRGILRTERSRFELDSAFIEVNHHAQVEQRATPDADAKHISAKLKRYHRLHADRDFGNIVRWLRSNLPTIQHFFGRDAELDSLLATLHQDATGVRALIDVPGGMGKTTPAIRAASTKPSPTPSSSTT